MLLSSTALALKSSAFIKMPVAVHHGVEEFSSHNRSPQNSHFDHLYKKYYMMVRGCVAKYRLPGGIEDDVIQETFLKAWQNLPQLKNPQAFSSWIRVIARNLCLRELKDVKEMISIQVSEVESSEEQWVEQVAIEADDIMEPVRLEYSLSLLRKLISNHQHLVRRQVAQLFYLDEYTVTEICEITQMKQNTVLSHLRRFRILVAEAMIKLVETSDLSIYRQ